MYSHYYYAVSMRRELNNNSTFMSFNNKCIFLIGDAYYFFGEMSKQLETVIKPLCHLTMTSQDDKIYISLIQKYQKIKYNYFSTN